MMSRGVGNSGYGLTDNGIVIADSGASSIRVRANLNNNDTLADPDEDVRYIYQAANKAIVRFDRYPAPTGQTTVVANSIDKLILTYWDATGTQITNSQTLPSSDSVNWLS